MIKRDARGRFMKGSSGNPEGVKRNRVLLSELVREIGDQMIEIKIDKKKEVIKKIECLVMKAYALGLNGDIQAIKFIASYRDGLPRQKMEVSGEMGAPIRIVFPKEFEGA